MIEGKTDFNRIDKADRLYIYGAGDVGRSAAYCLTESPFSKKIFAFLVSDIGKENRQDISGVPVISYKEAEPGILIIIAVMEKYRDEIVGNLREAGLTNYLLLTFENRLTSKIRQRCFFDKLRQTGRTGCTVRELSTEEGSATDVADDLAIYVAKSDVDKATATRILTKEWEINLQVGAALTDVRIADLRDDTGDSISSKNRQYCEMTALYWIWKNTLEQFIGLCHYRRRFDLTVDEIAAAFSSGVDIILLPPIFNVPSVRSMYEKNHVAEDWTIFRQAVETLSPEYLDAFERMENGTFYFPYNMFIARREILGAYCEWAFSVFSYCEEHMEKKDSVYQTRDIGFLSERVATVYLLHHWDRLQIAFADKIFYE